LKSGQVAVTPNSFALIFVATTISRACLSA
jgi:hypothetical protein